MRKILIFLIAIIFLFMNASAQVEWSEGITRELHLGEKMTEGNYTIEVYNFPAPVEGYKPIGKEEVPAVNIIPFVGVRLYNNTMLVEDWTLLQGDTRTYNDEVRITVESLPKGDAKEWINKYYNPTAKIKLQTGKFKESYVVITFTTGRECKPPSLIQLDVKVKNTGGEDAMDVSLNIVITTNLTKKEGILNWQRLNNTDTLKKGEEIIVPITYYTPLLFDEQNYMLNVAAESTWQDRNRTKTFKTSNTANFSIRILPQWDFTIQKSVKEAVHIGDDLLVSLTVQNTGLNYLDLEVVDTIPDGFTLLNGNLTWKPKIMKDGWWTESYKIKSPRPASLNLPPAKAIYRTALKNYTMESNSPGIVISGPHIILTKSLPLNGEVGSNLTVTLKVSNTGDRLAIVNLTDRIPKEANLVGGKVSAQLSLWGGEGKTIEYVLAFQNTGTFEVPPAEASFYEHLYITYRGVVTSETRTINITAKPEVTSPQQTSMKIEKAAAKESLFASLSRIYVFSIPFPVFIVLVFILLTIIIFASYRQARERKILKKYFK